MYIAPNTVVKLYRNVPLDNTYKHTIYFRTPQGQIEYFHETPEILKFTLNELSYQRVGKGIIRVGKKAEDLFDCNYLAFQNTAFGNKWFYAFITKTPEYINDTTCEIQYEIDVMQTYLGDVYFKRTFVEREMSENDEIGENTQPESIETGPTVDSGIIKTGFFNEYSICFIFSTGTDVSGFGGIPQITSFFTHKLVTQADFTAVEAWLSEWNEDGTINKLLQVFFFPSYFIPLQVPPYHDYRVFTHEDLTYVRPNMIGNYTPRNRKLLTYPYNFLGVDCGNDYAEYRYEWFNNNQIIFKLISEFSGTPKISLLPSGYQNGDTQGKYLTGNYQKQLIMEGFPQIAWSENTYQQWIAQQGVTMAIQGVIKVIAGAVSGSAAGVGGAIAGGVMSAVGSAVNFGLEQRKVNREGNETHGASTGSMNVVAGAQDFYFISKQITPEYARMIDDFFDMYGYACNRVKIPNLTSRRHWNYIKTRGANLFGNIPTDDLQKLKSIYDNGITMWFTPSEVGNYALDNRPYV